MSSDDRLRSIYRTSHRYKRIDRPTYSILRCKDCGQHSIPFSFKVRTAEAIRHYDSELIDCGEWIARQVNLA